MLCIHPYTSQSIVHRAKVTKRRMFKFFCFANMLSFLIISSFAEHSLSLPCVIFATGGSMCLLFIVFVYTSIFLTARKRLNPGNRPGVAIPTDESDTKYKTRFIKELKLAKSCVHLSCVHLVYVSYRPRSLHRRYFLMWKGIHFSVSGRGHISYPD